MSHNIQVMKHNLLMTTNPTIIMKRTYIVIWEHRHGVSTYSFREKENAQIIHDRLDSLINDEDEDEYDGCCEMLEEGFMEDNENFDPKTFKFM